MNALIKLLGAINPGMVVTAFLVSAGLSLLWLLADAAALSAGTPFPNLAPRHLTLFLAIGFAVAYLRQRIRKRHP